MKKSNVTLALTLALFASVSIAETHTIDNFNCGNGQQVTMSPALKTLLRYTWAGSDYEATSCAGNAINTVNAKRKLHISTVSPLKEIWFKVVSGLTATGGKADSNVISPNLPADSAICTLHYTFDKKALVAGKSKIQVTLNLNKGAAEDLSVLLPNNAEARTFIFNQGLTTTTFDISSIRNDANTGGVTWAAPTTLGSFSIATTCRSQVVKVTFIDGQVISAANSSK